jgi:hypothetical protein
MPIIQPEGVADLVADTLRDLGKPKFTDISSNLQRHVAMRNLLTKNRRVLESGFGVQFDVLVNQANNFRNVALAESDNLNLIDGMIQAQMNWRGSTDGYMIIGELIAMNAEPSRIVDYVKQQRLMCLISMAEGMESNFWGAPSATDQKTPYGMPYWVPKNATKGFNGGALTGFTTVANISPTTYPNWNNWTVPYTLVTKDDFIRGIREAAYRTDFAPTVDGIPSPNTGDDYGFYTNYSVAQPLEESLEAQNESLGTDIAKYDGHVVFLGVPVIKVPWLDRDTTNPYYGINWGWMKTYILRDWWMRETNIPYTPGQHTVESHYIDLRYQWVSKNRRCHFVASNGTTYPS